MQFANIFLTASIEHRVAVVQLSENVDEREAFPDVTNGCGSWLSCQRCRRLIE
jgi:hypothetical protein